MLKLLSIFKRGGNPNIDRFYPIVWMDFSYFWKKLLRKPQFYIKKLESPTFSNCMAIKNGNYLKYSCLINILRFAKIFPSDHMT